MSMSPMQFTEGNAMHTSIVTKIMYFDVNRNEMEKYSKEYAAKGEGCFVFELQRPGNGGWACIDATRAIGRLVNHSRIPM